jgi:hypothetical protein
MNQSLDLVSANDRAWMDQQSYGSLNAQSANCITGTAVQGYYGDPPPQHYHYHNNCQLGFCVCPPRTPADTELIIELCGKEIRLNYGARLRVLMAEPEKGEALRDALALVKRAMESAFIPPADKTTTN